ncbi:MAG: 3-dehydroquinate synthase [Bacteroidales bacterium]|nr:3-dehydroquinate synthase [Bacteroidales bacterium]
MNLPQNVVCTNNANAELANFIKDTQSKIFVLVDENTEKLCLSKLPILLDCGAEIIRIKSGECYKNITTLSQIWTEMSERKADRKSLFINLGGGVIGDMGGLAASLFKRGIKFVNIPTTLLAQVDASCGGKLAVDFNNLKNEIGLFRNPNKIIVDCNFLQTLPTNQIVSGFAEIIKHSLLVDRDYFEEISSFDPKNPDWNLLSNIVETSIKIKNEFTSIDPTEKGVRKMLNFGHTVGHAVESYTFSTNKPLLHGEAVAVGIVCELFLSNHYMGFPIQNLIEVTKLIGTYFPSCSFKMDIYQQLINLMQHDKKNSEGKINFALVSNFGKYQYDINCSNEDICQAFSFYNQLIL